MFGGVTYCQIGDQRRKFYDKLDDRNQQVANKDCPLSEVKMLVFFDHCSHCHRSEDKESNACKRLEDFDCFAVNLEAQVAVRLFNPNGNL